MKLVIQIPCLDEEEWLPVTLSHLPHSIAGIDEVEVLVIDDGSTDRTAQVAREWSETTGVPLTIAHHTQRRGLAAAFQTGLNTSLAMGADIIVHTDADNQYPGEYIPDLVRPILEKQADMVIADRQTSNIEHFSPTKKLFQKMGSLTVRIFSGSKVPDAPSGFRAFSRETALTLNVVTHYTYTIETIFQASKRNLAVTSIPIHTNKTRESKLVKSIWSYIKRNAATIVRIYAMHEPLKAFFYISIPFFIVAALGLGRFLYFSITERNLGARFIQSVILSGVALMMGILLVMIGLLADLIGRNRRLIEDNLFRVKKIELEQLAQKERESELLQEIRALREQLGLPAAPSQISKHIAATLTEVEEVKVEEIVAVRNGKPPA